MPKRVGPPEENWERIAAELRAKNSQLMESVELWQTRARDMRSELIATRRSAAELRADYQAAQKTLERLQDSFDKLFASFEKMANRPPPVAESVDVGELVVKITDGLAKIMVGDIPATQVAETQAEQTSMGIAVGEVPETRYFIPDIEQGDPWSEPTPVPGEWQVGTPAPIPDSQTPSHGIDPMGNLRRTDGQPMFLPGVGAPPPQGGVEPDAL